MSKKILVVKGGFSSEREVSLVTGAGVAKALKSKGYDVIEHDMVDGFALVEAIKENQIDVVFNALHGNFGEDGCLQGMLDILQLPYTHSSLQTSAIAMDKNLTKKIASEFGVPVAKGFEITAKDFLEKVNEIELPFVVKPVSDGSSVGVFVVREKSDLNDIKYPNPDLLLLVEEYIAGAELTVTVLNGKALAVTELKSKLEFYDYEAKYTSGVTEHILPAQIDAKAYEECLLYAQKMHQALGCNVVSRSDFRYNAKDGVVFLETNTNPGMTPLSLVPEQAKYVGISYEDLCVDLVENAKCKKI